MGSVQANRSLPSRKQQVARQPETWCVCAASEIEAGELEIRTRAERKIKLLSLMAFWPDWKKPSKFPHLCAKHRFKLWPAFVVQADCLGRKYLQGLLEGPAAWWRHW
ncbi:hypothetical protein SAMN02927895_05728 [Belnapia rosea]|nr:hypothetical protein SAMN02927895_05728 [Belnapia rosea]